MSKPASKPWYKSKTLWVNAVFAATTVAEANLQVIQSLMGAQTYLGMLAGAAFINCFLRFITTQGLTTGEKP